MRYTLVLTGMILLLTSCSEAQKSTNVNSYHLSEMHRFRDPSILAHPETNTYYLPKAGWPDGKYKMYTSKNLIEWQYSGYCLEVDTFSYWAVSDFWAPDIYQYKNRFYIFTTVGNRKDTTQPYRSGAIFVSDSPEGPYHPLENEGITPMEWRCIDPALYIDINKDPWLLYVHSWTQISNGRIIAQRISDDLTELIGEPYELFNAGESGNAEHQDHGVTDAPFVIRGKDDVLFMIWSTFNRKMGDGKELYYLFQARSRNGIRGPWEHNHNPLIRDGGHGFIFNTFQEDTVLAVHGEHASDNWHVYLYRIHEEENWLKLGEPLTVAD